MPQNPLPGGEVLEASGVCPHSLRERAGVRVLAQNLRKTAACYTISNIVMSSLWHWIVGGVLLLLLVEAGYWYHSNQQPGQSAGTTTPQTLAVGSNLTTSPQDVSDGALDQDIQAVDAQLQGLLDDLANANQSINEILAATTTSFLPPATVQKKLQIEAATNTPTSTLVTVSTTTPFAAAAHDATRARAPGMLYSTASTTEALGEMLALLSGRGGQVKDLVSALQDKADHAITEQVSVLTALSRRAGGVQQLPDPTKTALQQEIAAQSSALEDLRNKVFNEVSVSSLKGDAKTMDGILRGYALTVPKIGLIAAADRIATLSDDMQTVSAKFQARIDTTLAKGGDVSAAQQALTDYNAKTADAQTLASLTQNTLLNIPTGTTTPAAFTANVATLKDADEKITQAQQSLQAARLDLTGIRNLLSGDVQ